MKLFHAMLLLFLSACAGGLEPPVIDTGGWSDGVTPTEKFTVKVHHNPPDLQDASIEYWWSLDGQYLPDITDGAVQQDPENPGEGKVYKLIVRQTQGVKVSPPASVSVYICSPEECPPSSTDNDADADDADADGADADDADADADADADGGSGTPDDRHSCMIVDETGNDICFDSALHEDLYDWCTDLGEYFFNPCDSACFEGLCSFEDTVPVAPDDTFAPPIVDDLRIYASVEAFFPAALSGGDLCVAIDGERGANPEYDLDECEGEPERLHHCELDLYTGTSACFDSADSEALASACGSGASVTEGGCPVGSYSSVCIFDGPIAFESVDDPGIPGDLFGGETPLEDLRVYSVNDADPGKSLCESGGGTFTVYGCGEGKVKGVDAAEGCALDNCDQMQAVLSAIREDTTEGNYYFQGSDADYRATCRFDAVGGWMKVAFVGESAGAVFVSQMEGAGDDGSCGGATHDPLHENSFSYGFCAVPVQQLRICQDGDCLDSSTLTAESSPPTLVEMLNSGSGEEEFSCKSYVETDISLDGTVAEETLYGRVTASPEGADVRIGFLEDCADAASYPRYAIGVGFSVNDRPSSGATTVVCQSGKEELTGSGSGRRKCAETGIWVR